MYNSGDDIGALVCDIGSFATRIGFAGDDQPKAYAPTVVGATEESKLHFNLAEYRPDMSVESPLRDGIVHDWDMFEKLWEYLLKQYVKVNTAETPILMSEKPFNSSSSRQRMTEVMFEKYNAPAMFFSKDAVLSCYACGRTSGLTVDFGNNGTVVTPVVDGWVDIRGINKSVVGGRLLDSYMLSLLQTKNVVPEPLFKFQKVVSPENKIITTMVPDLTGLHASYDTFMRLEIARDIKETVCKMADSTVLDADPRYINIPLVPYELPDGTVVDLGIERFQVPDLLFCDNIPGRNIVMDQLIGTSQSSLIENRKESIPRLIFDSALKCDTDSQTSLLSNLVITGGSSSFEGLPDRLKLEVENLLYTHGVSLKVKCISAGVNERALCPWLGGSILASLGSFYEMWMTKQEFAEYGSSLVDRKCP